MLNSGMFSSDSSEWETPQDFFDRINLWFKFDLDAAASSRNNKCENYLSKENSCFDNEWYGTVFMNPPYGRDIYRFVKRAYSQAHHNPRIKSVVCLLPARTDTTWWHEYCMKSREIYLIRGRLKFSNYGPAPFPSALVVFPPIPYLDPILYSLGAKDGYIRGPSI